MALEDNASVHSVLTQPVDGLVRDGGAESVCAALKDLGTEADPRVRHGSLRTVLLEQPGERQPAQLRHNATITSVGTGQRDFPVRFKFTRRDES
jgi:hypothetical protein